MGVLPGRKGQGSKETLPEIKCLPRRQEEDSAPGHEQIQPKLHKLKFQVCPSDKTGKHICLLVDVCLEEKLNLQHFEVAVQTQIIYRLGLHWRGRRVSC